MALAAKILSKKPSEVLLNLIKEIGQLGTKLANIFETIKQKGHEEGFTYDEIKGSVPYRSFFNSLFILSNSFGTSI